MVYVYVTHLRGMSQMSGILILSYRVKEMIKFLCFTLFLKLKNCSHLWNQISD